MLRIERIIGSRLDPHIAESLHDLEHHGAMDVLVLQPVDVSRRRIRARTRAGTDVAISLSRDDALFDGAVLLLEATRAIVVRVDVERWLKLTARSAADAIELGYQAGNLHWRVRFVDGALLVALEAPAEQYLARIEPLLADGRVAARQLAESEAP